MLRVAELIQQLQRRELKHGLRAPVAQRAVSQSQDVAHVDGAEALRPPGLAGGAEAVARGGGGEGGDEGVDERVLRGEDAVGAHAGPGALVACLQPVSA